MDLDMKGLRLEDLFSSDPRPMKPFQFDEEPPRFLMQHNFQYGPSSSFSSMNQTSSTAAAGGGGGGDGGTVTGNTAADSPEDSEVFSDIVLNYISNMLMEEGVDEKVNILYQEKSEAIEAAEKPFYDILGETYPPPSSQSPDDGSSLYAVSSTGSSSSSAYSSSGSWGSVYDPQFYPVSIDSSVAQSSFSSLGNGGAAAAAAATARVDPDPAWQFRKGVEEAKKFLPRDDKLVIDLEGTIEYQEPRTEKRFVDVKLEREEREYPSKGLSRVRKNPNSSDLDLVEGRSIKQSAVSSSSEETVRSEIFDMILLCQKGKSSANGVDALREAMQNEVSNNNSQGGGSGPNGKAARRKKQTKKEVVDLRTLLIHCSQAVAADDRWSTNELLKQVRQYSSPFGDGTQRLAHCFADGLEARLAGTGSQIYHSLVAKRTTATDILKAYQLYLAACPFKRISHFFSNQTILDVAENATRVHIIDFGIYFGFQWPCLIQRLASRPQGPPKLRITGIDVPQPGFRPTERIEETGKRLADYARSFNVPFEYNAIASRWETIRVEELKIDKDEVLVVNCLYRFRNLVDETVVVDSPRNMVLNTIRKANPDVFIHGIVNGSYSAPFFVTRFREALFHFSALFDMLETNVPREDAQRLLIERDLFGREALNVISCEGSERVERPETYKQWQVRNLRAGLTQLPLNQEITNKARGKVKGSYHKDFVIDEDSQWLLQGWKGRIIYAISTWKPNRA